MSTILVSRHFVEQDAIVVHDVGSCIRSWGRRGILSGGIFGFVLAAIIVAVPSTSEVLTFGTIGTLIVSAIECAVVAGGICVLAAALYGQGVLRGNTTGMARTLSTGGLKAAGDWPEGKIPPSDWPARWASPGSLAAQSILQASDDYRDIIAPSVQQAQMTMSAIDSWENGGCGP